MKPPEKGTKEYLDVVNAGCGSYYDAWNGDYDCQHGYGWNCDWCPCVQEAHSNPDDEEIIVDGPITIYDLRDDEGIYRVYPEDWYAEIALKAHDRGYLKE